MKILSCNPKGSAFHYILKGIEDAFVALGHQFIRWDGRTEVLKNYQPDLYLGCSGWRQDLPKWCRDMYGTKIAIHANPYGTVKLIPLKGEPNINEPQGAIDWVLKQNPDAVYCYANDLDISRMWNFWEERHGLLVIPMPTAGNSIIHQPVVKDPKFKCQIGFIGGYWPYKAMNIKKYVTPVINAFTAQVYGWGGWSHSKYKGTIKDQDVNKLFSSALICPSVVEPHTTRYGIDVPERMWKVPLGGGMTILDPFSGVENYVDTDVFPIAQDPQDYFRLIKYYLVKHEERASLALAQRQYVLENHTYFHRISRMLNDLGFIDEAEACDGKISEIAQT